MDDMRSAPFDDNKPGRQEGTDQPLDSNSTDADTHWLQTAREAFSQSTTWLDSAVRRNWERNLANFHNRHPSGSKFNRDDYKGRSKLFRPKTRLSIRAAEAAFAAAMFSTADLVTVEAEDSDNPKQVSSAAVNQALMQYRLSKTIPWFLTSVGAFQDGQVYGVSISYQYWHYEELEYEVPVTQNGQPVYGEDGAQLTTTHRKVVQDKPCIDLMAPENLRIDASADWRDPIQSSPYCVRLVPMYVLDVLDAMEKQRPGRKWRKLKREQLIASKTETYDSTRNARDNERMDPKMDARGDYRTVWLHENFIRIEGEDYVYWTVGTEHMLSDPVPIEEAYLHGKRPMVLGYVVLESHRSYPSAPADLSAGLQESSNHLANQRHDNVELVLNKRYFIRRGQQLDIDALMRNVPGGGVMVDDPEKDVKIVSTPDVTQSSYEEQDRIDNQMDEMMGNFSQSSVLANNALDKTLGSVKMLGNSASAVTEYTIRTFVETWVEPVLRQLMMLEQFYETDAKVLALASKSAGLRDKMGVDEVTDDLLVQDLTLSVNVGIGNTNPQQAVERLLYGLNAVATIPGVAQRIRGDEVVKEVFGKLGYKTGSRFITPQEEMPEAAPDPMAQAETAKAANDAKRLEIEEKKTTTDAEMRKLEIDRRREESNARMALDRELGYAKIALEQNLTIKDLEARLWTTQVQDRTKRQTAVLSAKDQANEIALKRQVGSGI